MPSVNSTANRARSAVTDTISLCGEMWIRPRNPSLTSAPPRRKSSEVDRTVRAASPDSRTATSSATPKTATSTMTKIPDRQKRHVSLVRRPGFPALRNGRYTFHTRH